MSDMCTAVLNEEAYHEAFFSSYFIRAGYHSAFDLFVGMNCVGAAESASYSPVLSLEYCDIAINKASGMLRVHDERNGEWRVCFREEVYL